VYVALFGLAAAGFAAGGRSDSLLVTISCLMLMYFNSTNSMTSITWKSKKVVGLLLLAFSSIFLTQQIYVYAVHTKLFPEKFQTKFEKQLQTGLPVIFSGRTEIFGSFAAIQDSPIVGHGSWASNPKYLILVLKKQNLEQSIFERAVTIKHDSKIPAHSFIFGAWVEHGVLAVFFFLFFGFKISKLFLLVFNNTRYPIVPYLLFICVSYMWHLFFSPIGMDKRIYVSLILVCEFYFIKKVNHIPSPKIYYDSIRTQFLR
jgi:hypothetical protein